MKRWKKIVPLLVLPVNLMLGLASAPGCATAQETPGGFFLEPGVTYQRTTGNVDYPFPFSSSELKQEGFGLVTRLGAHVWETIFLGVDGRYARPDFKDANNNYRANSVAMNAGPVVGVQMPIFGLRAWGTYVLFGSADPKEHDGLDLKAQNAQGFRLGAGIRLFMASVNLEYQDIKYDEILLERIGRFSSGSVLSNLDFHEKGLVASVTLPLEL